MKTKKLIELLQKEDPSGEMECCVGNSDIAGMYIEPAYWDGCMQVLKREEDGGIVGGKYCSEGAKLVIHPLSIFDAIFDNENLPVEYDSEYSKRHYESRVEEYRKKTNSICNGIEKDLFIEYMSARLGPYGDFDEEEIKQVASEFYDANMDYKDEMPKDIIQTKTAEGWGASWNERRKKQWDKELGIKMVEGKMAIFKL